MADYPQAQPFRRGLLQALLGAGTGGTDTDPENRIEDDRTRSPYGEPQAESSIGQSVSQRPVQGSTSDLEDRAAAGRPSLADQMSAPVGPSAPDHLQDLQSQYDRLNPTPQPMSLKQKLLKGALGAATGFLGGRTTLDKVQQQRDFEQNQNREKSQNLLSQIEAERRMQQTGDIERDRMTLQQQMEQDRLRQQQEMAQPEHMDTDQGPISYNRQTRQWEPIMVGGQRVGPKAQPKPDTPEQQFIDSPEEQGKTLTQKLADYERITQKPDRGANDRASARGDRSYQFNAGRVDKLAAPIEQRAERLSRLTDTLAQGDPQSDALVAPELLTVMAGGQGSGLRMNEAEISRIVGGRTVWEGIKAKLGAYQMDPNKGFALTPAQRQQVGNLMKAVQQRVNQKMQILDEERQNLSATDDPMEHRKIVNRVQKRLSDADTAGGGQGGQGGPAIGTVEGGYRFKGGNPADQNSWEPVTK